MSLLRPIFFRSLRNPFRTAIIDDRGKTSYLKLALGAMYVAQHIQRLTRRANVGLILPTSSATPIAMMGAWHAGRVPIPFNYLLSRDELRYVLLHSEVDTVLTVGPMLDFLGGPEVIPKGIRIVKMEELSFKSLPPLALPRACPGDQPATILYTSGTSGKPKGVVLTHRNLFCNVMECIVRARFRRADVFLGVLPQFHSFGLTGLTWAPLALGATVVYTARFVPRKIVDLIREHHPHVFMGVPSMFNALLAVKDATPADFKSIRMPVSGGEPLPQAVASQCAERLGVNILEGYGLTETSPVVSWCTPWMTRPGSVGKPLDQVDVRILDEHDKPLPRDTDGEIVIHGPNVMKGYFKDPELTESVMMRLDGRRYFRTGDFGRIDREGYLYITGRKKEMLIIAGENVFPREIEEALNRHPAVKDSGVVGRRDDVRGELPVAFVELKEGATLNESEIRAFLRERIAGYKVPREIIQLETLPRSPTGKILRRKLAEMLVNSTMTSK